MAIYYTIVQRVNPANPVAPRKFYAVAKSTGEESTRDIALQISKRNNMSVADVYACLEALLDLIPELLAKGKIVRLGELGSFRMTITGKGADTAEEYSKAYITNANVRFFPGNVFQKEIDTLDFKKYTTTE